ncbi:MAG: hypothetical protein SGJ27_16255 [Candidatus Melainabacteria bacterium]|nr:hypothetical protein [Candidatus Melainabacteria bacterium]
MTTEIEDPDDDSEGAMSEHLQRYRKYIDSLKQGRSSGISSVFGRASDLLPPDVLEIKPPTMVAERIPTAEQVIGDFGNANHINRNVENVRSERLNFDDDDEVVSGDVERGEAGPKDLDPDHGDDDDNAEDLDPDEDDDASSGDSGSDDDDQEDIESDEDDDDDDSDVEDDDEEVDDVEEDDDDDDDDAEDEDEEVEDQDDVFEEQDSKATDDDDTAEDDTETEELTVQSAQGNHLWTIYFNRVTPLVITMSDGSSIQNAEGRDDTILSLRNGGGSFKFFILSGLVIDPITGNIYVEANDGAFTAAFMNNGWQIQQYRNHEGEETYYATEPFKSGRDRLTMQITNVALDPVHGEVSYDSLDGSASMTLKSRKLLRSGEN